MKADQNGHGGGHGAHLTEGAASMKSIAAHHEVSDVELRGIVVFLLGLTLMTVVVYFLMLLLFNLLNIQEGKLDQQKPQSPLALSEKERLPPEPRLQSAPGFAEQLGKEVGARGPAAAVEDGKPKDRTWELDELKKMWEADLEQGPKDQKGNAAGISIEQAKQQVLSGSGLPSRAPLPKASDQKGAESTLQNEPAITYYPTTPTQAGGAEKYAVEMPTAASSGRMTEKRKQ